MMSLLVKLNEVTYSISKLKKKLGKLFLNSSEILKRKNLILEMTNLKKYNLLLKL